MHRNVGLARSCASIVIALGALAGCSSESAAPAAPAAAPAPGELRPLPESPSSAGAPAAEDGSAAPAAPAPGAATPANPAEAPAPMNLAPAQPAAPPPPAAAPGATVPLCGAKMRVQSPLIADFEVYDGSLEAGQFTFRFGSPAPNAGVFAGVFAFDDMTGTSTRFGILAGRTGGWGASQQILQATAWGGGLGLWFDCVDASAFSGISFWVRGTTVPGTFSVTAGFLRTSPVNAADARGGGTCTGGAEGCKSPSAEALPLTLDWTRIDLPWSSFTSGLDDGQPFVPNGDELMGLTFGLPIGWGPDPAFVDNPNDMTDMPVFLPLPSDIIFQVDDINFVQR